jgi:LacI family gluconate utilization system Gnt-II transcriptional activator
MRNHRISLQDIATLAGVTKMTVSRYIRSPKKVAKETGERIAKIMEEINYIPNRAPGMLLNAQSYTLGILIPSFQNQLFADILAGIESVTSEHNYQTLIANYNYDRDSEEESVINLLSYNIDGIILSEKYHTIRTVKFLRSATIPVVELMDVQGERLDMVLIIGRPLLTWCVPCWRSESGTKFCISVPKMTPAMNSVIRGIAMR